MSPTDCRARRCRCWITAICMLLIVAAVAAVWGWYQFFHEEP